MRYGRIISLSSCSTMWQCQTMNEDQGPSAESLAAKVESVDWEVRGLREEIAAYERPRVKSAAELASKIAGRPVSDEEVREKGAQRREEFYQRFRDRSQAADPLRSLRHRAGFSHDVAAPSRDGGRDRGRARLPRRRDRERRARCPRGVAA